MINREFAQYMSQECERLLGGRWSVYDIKNKLQDPLNFIVNEIVLYCSEMRKMGRLWQYGDDKVLFPKVVLVKNENSLFLELDIENPESLIKDNTSTRPDGKERRKYSRIESKFVVSYKLQGDPGGYDLSHTSNISQGGLFIVVNKVFEPGSHLLMIIRLPIGNQKIEVTGEVVSSSKKPNTSLYGTRVKFLDLDKDLSRKIGEFVEEMLKRQ